MIQEENEDGDEAEGGGRDAMIGTPVFATDAFQPAHQNGGGAEEINFEDWMEPEGSDGKGGSDSEYQP